MLSEGRVRNYGLRVGRLFGIEIWFHWIFVVFVGIQLVHNFMRAERIDHPVLEWLVYVFTFALSILLHEFGHCYAAFRSGGGADRVVLWPLGGLAYCDSPDTPRAKFWVAAAGPLVNLGLGVFAVLVCVLAGWSLLPQAGAESGFIVGDDLLLGQLMFQYLFVWNAFLLILNLLPCYPLDGGRMLQAHLWARLESFGEGSLQALRASRIVAILAAVGAGVIILAGLFHGKMFDHHHPLLACMGWGLLCVAILHFVEARQLRMQLEFGLEEDNGIFGYDFSHGYTSLERSAPVPRKPSWWSQVRERSRQRAGERQAARDREVRQRLDVLLEKIHRDGMASLSREERRFLERASKHFRNLPASKDG